MELPADVLVHNEILGLKGSQADLIRVSSEGYYEMNLTFGERKHRVLLPIAATAVISRLPEDEAEADFEIER